MSPPAWLQSWSQGQGAERAWWGLRAASSPLPCRTAPGAVSQPKRVPRRAQTPPGRGPRRGRARPGRQVLLFGRQRDRAGGSARPPMLLGGHRTPTGTGSPSRGPPAALMGWAGDVLSPSPGRDRAAERLWSAGKGQSCWHLPQISAQVPPEMCVPPPPSPCLGHKAAGPVGLGGGSGSSVPCTGPGWAQSGRGQEQPPGIRALISAPAGGRSPPLGGTSGDSRLSHVLFTCTHRNLPLAQPPALMLWRRHRLCLVPEGSPAEIGAAALRSLGRVRPWPLGFREVGSRVTGQGCG